MEVEGSILDSLLAEGNLDNVWVIDCVDGARIPRQNIRRIPGGHVLDFLVLVCFLVVLGK